MIIQKRKESWINLSSFDQNLPSTFLCISVVKRALTYKFWYIRALFWIIIALTWALGGFLSRTSLSKINIYRYFQLFISKAYTIAHGRRGRKWVFSFLSPSCLFILSLVPRSQRFLQTSSRFHWVSGLYWRARSQRGTFQLLVVSWLSALSSRGSSTWFAAEKSEFSSNVFGGSCRIRAFLWLWLYGWL